MSKEMDNQSFNERNSLTGNSGLLGFSSIKPKLKPVRIKELMDMYGSDDEDSEDKGKDSNSDSECEDVQPLPQDSDEKLMVDNCPKLENRLSAVTEEISSRVSINESSNLAKTSIFRKIEFAESGRSNNNENTDCSVSKHFTDNFSLNSERNEAKVFFESSSTDHLSDTTNRRSNIKLEVPDIVDTLLKPPTISSSNYSDREIHCSKNSMILNRPESNFSLQPSRTPSRFVADTPMKNNPPIGSLRPTPSNSHRNIFQTPQDTKFSQDYTKNQTPATIFGNWSKKHMSHTPMENRTKTGDSLFAIDRSSQQFSSLETRSVDKENRVKKPLAKSFGPSKLNLCSTSEESLKNIETQSCRVSGDEKCPGSLIREDCNENRFPMSVKSNEESSMPEASKNEVERMKMSGQANEMFMEPKIVKVEKLEEKPSSFRNGDPSLQSRESIDKKNFRDEMKIVQASIPSQLRRSDQGKIISVKGKDYFVLGPLGMGMSGQVLRVQDIQSLELRAVKIVDLSRMDKDCAQGCLQEISMLHKLQAPCIIEMFDYDIKYPIVHVVMEMGDTDFKNLLNSMTDKNRLSLTMILYYWTEMLTAVKHIHDNGVIHSDLKPANFLLVRGRLKLIDFGIASSMNSDMTSVVKNNPVGTLNYISPEAVIDISGNNPDSLNTSVKYKINFKSDVWSLGCILYSMVYGYTPFHNIRPNWAKINAITNPRPKISFGWKWPVGNENDVIPPILIDVMKKCLQHDPKARPTVAQLLQIPYIPIKSVSSTPAFDIPSNILMKIKHSLTDSEWQQFTEIMEAKRSQ